MGKEGHFPDWFGNSFPNGSENVSGATENPTSSPIKSEKKGKPAEHKTVFGEHEEGYQKLLKQIKDESLTRMG